MAQAELVTLPCQHDGCTHTVDFTSEHSDWLDFWLDGIITCWCPLHRDRPA